MSEPLLVAENVSKSYWLGPERILVLDGLDMTLERGEIVAVVGASGVGKSTLLNILGLLDSPDEGTVKCGGVDLFANPADLRAEWRNRVFGFVFQFYHLIPELTALENVVLPSMMYRGATSGGVRATREKARKVLTDLGLGERLKHRPKQLSGGERQRVAIARALVNEPEVLLCDEPTGNLDARTSEGVQSILWELNEQRGQTMLIVTHEEEIAERAHRVLRMEDGKLVDVPKPGPPRERSPVEVRPIEPVPVSRMPLVQLLFSLEGRIGRVGYLLAVILIMLVNGGIFFLERTLTAGRDMGVLYTLTMVIGALVISWPSLATGAKRCHDRNRTGWFLAVGLIPVIGPVWLFVELYLLTGTEGTNRFGPDPRRDAYGTRPGPRSRVG